MVGRRAGGEARALTWAAVVVCALAGSSALDPIGRWVGWGFAVAAVTLAVVAALWWGLLVVTAQRRAARILAEREQRERQPPPQHPVGSGG